MTNVEITRATLHRLDGLDEITAKGGGAIEQLLRLFANDESVGITTVLVLTLAEGMGKKCIELYKNGRRISVILTP